MQQTILAQSADYYVKASYETAELYAKCGDKLIAFIGACTATRRTRSTPGPCMTRTDPIPSR